jgi:phosphatidate cytidylyltransferase
MTAWIGTTLDLPQHVVVATLSLWGVLIVATGIVLALSSRESGNYRELIDRTASWW